MKYIKVFGIEMSGSSFLASCLRLSFKVRVFTDEFGWVHGLPKPPQIWINSHECPESSREEMRAIMTDEGFINFIVIIRNPYDWYHLTKLVYKEKNLRRAYEKYTRLYRGYKLMLLGNHSFFARGICVKFEDLRESPWDALYQIDSVLGIERKQNPKYIKPPKIEINQGIPQDELDIINRILPDDLFFFYGYERIIKTSDL